MKPIKSSIQALDAVSDLEVNVSGVAQALSAHSGREGDNMTAMLSFVLFDQLDKLKEIDAWLASCVVAEEGDVSM